LGVLTHIAGFFSGTSKKKIEELKRREGEHALVSAAIFRDWIAKKKPAEQLREELQSLMVGRRLVRNLITADVLFLQLQLGAWEREKVTDAIMEFDDDSIRDALRALIEQGWR